MNARIGIRLEDKNAWERRAPLIPAHVKMLQEQHGIEVFLQSSPLRVFSEGAYAQAGAAIVPELSACPVIFAIKEIPPEVLEPRKTYIFFSHTIKGQKHSLPMLRRLLELGCQLIDYERIVNDQGRRVIFFGNYAGLAGMMDTLWALGRRLAGEGLETPFSDIRHTLQYTDLAAVKAAIREAGQRIAAEGLPAALTPLICGFAGYGNVSRGAQELYDLLPVIEIAPEDLASCDEHDPHHVYKVIFKEQDMVEPRAPGATFALQDYYDHPKKYRARFEQYLPHLTVLLNAIYWTERYPRLVTKRALQTLFSQGQRPRLRVIGDVSCDIAGAIECNVRATDPGNPIYVYNPRTGQTRDGYHGEGVVVLAVDNLPCELPIESSTHFSNTLLPFVPELALADYNAPFEQCDLSPLLKRAVIVWQGELTPDYRYLSRFLIPDS